MNNELMWVNELIKCHCVSHGIFITHVIDRKKTLLHDLVVDKFDILSFISEHAYTYRHTHTEWTEKKRKRFKERNRAGQRHSIWSNFPMQKYRNCMMVHGYQCTGEKNHLNEIKDIKHIAYTIKDKVNINTLHKASLFEHYMSWCWNNLPASHF